MPRHTECTIRAILSDAGKWGLLTENKRLVNISIQWHFWVIYENPYNVGFIFPKLDISRIF
jgi:hypothetical protein